MTETPEPTDITPETFDFSKWLAGAYKPTRGSTVHQRGDLIAELDRLREQIELMDTVPDDERSLADLSPDRLREQYAAIAQQFHDSGLFVKTSGHTREEMIAISKALDGQIAEGILKDALEGEKADAYRNEQSKKLTYHLLADAVVSPRLTAGQLEQLHSVVGEYEYERIVSDYTMASSSLNEPDADFLPKPSTPDEIDE
jgi:hypothetical protein